VPDLSWRPPPEIVERANSTRFARLHGIEEYRELVHRSSEEPEWFWDAVVRHLPIEFSTPYERVLDVSAGAPWARWFVGGRLNRLVARARRRPRRGPALRRGRRGAPGGTAARTTR
jgi:acetyl-CoA synthetase